MIALLPWKQIGLAAAVLALLTGVYLRGRHDQHGADNKALAAVQRDLGTCHNSLQNLQTTLDRQSAAVKAMADESARHTAAAQKAVQAAHAGAVAASERAGRVMSLTPGADRCASAFELMRKG